MGGLGALCGFFAALIASSLIPELSLGNTLDDIGRTDVEKFVFFDKPFGIVGHSLLGLLVCGSVTFVALRGRTAGVRLRGALLAAASGAVLCNAASATSDLMLRALARSVSPDGKVSLTQLDRLNFVPSVVWYVLVAFGLAFSIFLGIGPSRFLFGRVLIGTALAVVISHVIAQIAFILVLPVLFFEVLNAQKVEAISISSFVRPILWGQLFGMGAGAAAAFAVAEMMWKPAWLKSFRGPSEGRQWTITGQLTRIGCQEGLEVCLPPDGMVAAVHAQIQAEDGAHFIVDLAGGTTVNSRPVKTEWLADGDAIGVGTALMTFHTRTKGKEQPRRPAMHVRQAVLIDSRGQRHLLHPGVNVIGRELGCDIALTWEQSVSRRHAKLVVGPSGATVQDLGSTNGTFVAGKRVSVETSVDSESEIVFGHARVKFDP